MKSDEKSEREDKNADQQENCQICSADALLNEKTFRNDIETTYKQSQTLKIKAIAKSEKLEN